MATITKKELVNRIAGRTRQTKMVTKEVIQMFLDEIVAELGAGNRLEFREFGVFEIKQRAARKAQNPRTLQKVDAKRARSPAEIRRYCEHMVEAGVATRAGQRSMASNPSRTTSGVM